MEVRRRKRGRQTGPTEVRGAGEGISQGGRKKAAREIR